MERSKAGSKKKKKVPTAYHALTKIKYNNNKHYMVAFYKKWKNYN